MILEKTIRFPRSLSVKAASVLKGFLNKNPADRLGCHRETGFLDIVNHPFFKSIDWEMVSGNPFSFSYSISRVSDVTKIRSRKAIKNWTEHQFHSAWRDMRDLSHGKLFIGRPCKKRADNLLKLSRPQLRMTVAILMGHAPMQKHLCVMGLFDGDPTCRFYKTEAETVQYIVCCC